jgi:hypothetical protein
MGDIFYSFERNGYASTVHKSASKRDRSDPKSLEYLLTEHRSQADEQQKNDE